MAEMARQISAQLDTRTQKLEMLIKEADEKMAELRALMEKNVEPPRMKTMRLVDDDTELLPRRMTIPPSQPDPRYEQVYALADQGASAPEIAKRLNRPSGEVELILKLRGG
jgi:DNA-binding NarL/FixJ family response regulator